MKWKPRSTDCLFPLQTRCPQFSCLSIASFLPWSTLCGPQLGNHVLISVPQRIKWGQGCSLVPHFTHHRWANDIRGRLGWAFSGHQLAFWKFSSPSEAGCRERWLPRPKNVSLADCPFFNCCPGNHKTSCPGRMETAEGGSVRLGIAGAPAIPRTPPGALWAPSQATPSSSSHSSGNWQEMAGRGGHCRGQGCKGGTLLGCSASTQPSVPWGGGLCLDILLPLALKWGWTEILSLVVTLDKEGGGVETPFVPSLVPNVWRGQWCSVLNGAPLPRYMSTQNLWLWPN